MIGHKCNLKVLLWLAVLLLYGFTSAAAEQDWWNEDWQYRKKIVINTTTSGADIKENLVEVPVLIRLHTGNFDFTSAQPEGEDIRFVSSDGAKLLKHHIERYDMIDEMALLWVKLPRLSAQTDQEYIWIYYGNKDAMGGQDAKSTFDDSQAAVFHLSEIEGTPQDVSAANQSVSFFSGGLGLPAVIGGGAAFNGAGDRMQIANAPSLNFSNGFTFAAWVRINQLQQDGYLFHAFAETGEIAVAIDGSKIYGRVAATNDQIFETDRSTDLALGQWHHVMITAAANQRLTLYLDGLEMFFVNIQGSFPEFKTDYMIGSAVDGGHGYAGDLDEVRLSTTVRPVAWARAAFASQGPDGLLFSFGEAQAGGGGGLPVFYLGTIMKNITIDGWLVIGLLILLMIVSWIIFLSKAYFLWNADKENHEFTNAFKKMDNPVAAYDPENGTEYEYSNLYSVYATGCNKVIEARNNGRSGDTEGVFKSFKTALEEGFINESKRLNGYLVFLTMAISGGPFLGLLGTVWGVMNTFAAMAEAGEANIMAIAPGVASALSTTVFGLIVAIPALFAYNFLTSRIKTITADLTVFVDQLTLKTELNRGEMA